MPKLQKSKQLCPWQKNSGKEKYFNIDQNLKPMYELNKKLKKLKNPNEKLNKQYPLQKNKENGSKINLK